MVKIKKNKQYFITCFSLFYYLLKYDMFDVIEIYDTSSIINSTIVIFINHEIIHINIIDISTTTTQNKNLN